VECLLSFLILYNFFVSVFLFNSVATLGIVEFFLHLLAEYNPDYDKERKQVFADVHFLLFYTAILNALQTVLTAFVTTQRSKRLWVKTEMLELHHYVEIREEFQRVSKELERLKDERNRNSSSSFAAESTVTTFSSDFSFDFDRRSLLRVWRTFVDRIRYPNLQRKYNQLLTQIRFHELRVHFLEAYALPKKLKISDYLIRSEKDLLVQLVRVSTVAWLLLTGVVCLVYYVLGMVFYNYKSEVLVGTALIWIFFCSVAVFVFLSWVVNNKMKSIFRSIMHEKTLWDVLDTETETKDRLAQQQLALFWFGEPKYVVTALKFMQFGYAVALSTLVVYFEEINDGEVRMEWYMIIIFLCYVLFVHVTGEAIPRFVLCTSLGQLVDERRLREVVALFRLDEAKQKQLELLADQTMVQTYYGKDVLVQRSLDPMQQEKEQAANGTAATTVPSASSLMPPENNSTPSVGVVRPLVAEPKVRQEDEFLYAQPPAIPTVREGVPTVHEEESYHDDPLDDPFASFNAAPVRGRNRRRKVASDGVAAMASLQEQVDTEELVGNGNRTTFSKDDSNVINASEPFGRPVLNRQMEDKTTTADDLAARRRERRARRKKSTSDGVALMAQLRQAEAGTEFSGNRAENPPTQQRFIATLPPIPGSKAVSHHGHRKPQKKVDEGDLLAELVKLDTDSLRTTLEESDRSNPLRHSAGATNTARRNRRKTVSDGVAAMAAMGGNVSSAAGKVLKGAKSPKLFSKDDLNMLWRTTSTELNQPEEELLQAKSSSDEAAVRRRDRRARQKSMSDGVASMVSMSVGNFQQDFDIASLLRSQPDSVVHQPTTIPDEGLPSQRPDPGGECNGGVPGITDEANIDPLANGYKDADDASIHSTTSTVGGYSDVDDIPATAPSMSTKNFQEQLPPPSLRLRLHSYFLSKQYVVLSNVFGTLVCFFLVGHRVEGFIHSEAIISADFVSLYVPLSAVFWLETTWYLLFLVTSGLIFYSIGHVEKAERTHKDNALLLAAILDFVLIAVCLTVFFVAEAKRCCDPIEYEARLLAGDPYAAYGDDVAKEDSYNEPTPCGCPAFGSRAYSGLGKIEPYTSLVVLRIFRHLAARRLVRRLIPETPDCKKSDGSRHDDEEDNHDEFIHRIESEADPLISHNDVPYDKELVTVVAQVWESTIAKHPELAQMHGEFSGEILRAMLGVALLGSAPVETTPDVLGNPSTEVAGEPARMGRPGLPSSQSFSLNQEYSGLSSEAQGIILAGKLGCSLVQCSTSPRNLPTVDEVSESRLEEGSGYPSFLRSGSLGDINTVFEIDTRDESQSDFMAMFVSPNARLVRSMRRCHRKLLPILDKWTVVDVVITRFEMVYFDAVGVDEVTTNQEYEGTRQAIAATKGGKGLRLCDVAVGRRIVGHLLLTDVASVYVERKMPSDGNIVIGDDPEIDVEKTEFWKSHHRSSCADGLTLGSEWSTMKQDRVKILTQHGHKLYFRFLADFEHGKQHPDLLSAEDEVDGVINKNNAIQWTQTIVRFCGPAQLRQPLPHFGDDTTEELRDFLIVIPSGGETRMHHRRNSTDNLFRMSSRQKLTHHHRRASANNLAVLNGVSEKETIANDGSALYATHPVEDPRPQTDAAPSPQRSRKTLLSKRVSFSEEATS